MATRFFKKFNPNVPVYLSNGAPLNFTRVGRNQAVFETDDAGVQAQLDSCIRGQRGGVEEIQQSEYESLKKNTNRASLNPWREEISNMRLKGRSGLVDESVAVAVVDSPERRQEEAAAVQPAPSSTPVGPGDFERPKATKR